MSSLDDAFSEIISDESPEDREQNKRRSEMERDALRSVLGSRNGRRLIWALLGKCGFSRSAFTGENNATNFNLGRQSVATDLITEMDTINADAFWLMAKEAKEDENYVNGTKPDHDA